MTISDDHLIWLDLEMTGLNPDKDKIIEMATIVTTKDLNVIEESPVFTIHQSNEVLENMNDWVTNQHTSSGLIDRVKESKTTEGDAETQMIDFLSQYVPPGKSPMCGNSICMDRRFLYHYMPTLEQYFHYRNLDVSSLKILVQHWAPELTSGYQKESQHLALQDIRDSIEELKYYREHFIKT